MPAQTTPDKHTFPIAMDEAGSLWVNHRLVWSAGTGLLEHDIAELGVSIARNGDWWEISIPPIVAREGDNDALKLSGLRKVRVRCELVDGRMASEDAIDINRCEDVDVAILRLYPGQRYCGTIKGESQRCKISVGLQVGHAREVDWDYGNHENTKNGYTRGQSLTVTGDGTGSITVRCIQAPPVQLSGGPFKYRFPDPRKPYHWLFARLFTLVGWRFL